MACLFCLHARQRLRQIYSIGKATCDGLLMQHFMMDKYVLLQGRGVGVGVGCVISTYSCNHNGFGLSERRGERRRRAGSVSKLKPPSLDLELK